MSSSPVQKPDDARTKEPPRRRSIGITQLLAFGIGGLVTLAVTGVAILGFSIASSNTRLLLGDKSQAVIEAIEVSIDTHLQPVARMASLISEMVAISIEDGTPVDTGEILAMNRLAPQIRGTAIFYRDGRRTLVGRAEGVLQGRWEEQDGIAEGFARFDRQPTPRWLDPVYSDIVEDTLIIAQHPVVIDGKVEAFVATVVTTSAISGFLDTQGLKGAVGFVLVGDRVIAHPRLVQDAFRARLSEEEPLLRPSDIGDRDLQQFVDGFGEKAWIAVDVGDVDAREFEYDDAFVIVFARTIYRYGENPWVIGAHLDPGESDEDLTVSRLSQGIGVATVLVILTIIPLFLLARRMRRPIRDLASASTAIANLDIDQAPPLTRSGITELDQAADAFGRMTNAMQSFATYVPRTLVLNLLRSDDAVSTASQTRAVTVLFTDIVGFTTLTEGKNAADTAELLNHHFALLNRYIEAENGTIDKYIGDSVMAFWGAPLDQPDHAARATRAANAIVQAIHDDNLERTAKGEPPIRLRIGLHSGEVLAGDIGSPGRINYTVVGETVNTANRLEQLGKDVDPDGEVVILASQAVVEAADPAASFKPRGERQLRGLSTTFDVYQLS